MKADTTQSRASPSPSLQGRVLFEQEGHTRIDRIVASARETPWGLTALQLLWTAGPVTFLALQGGHFLGFGRPASLQTILYFGGYTLLLGIIGLIARFAANLTRGRQQNEARENLTRVLDLLPDMIFEVRDLGLAALPEPTRRREAASIMLHRADLGPESVALAVKELTEDSQLAQAAQEIEIYRRLGMRSRVNDLVGQTAERRASALSALHATAPESAEILRNRLSGGGPSQERGVPRSEGFIERILSAADRDDLSLMTLADAEDLVVLCLELMSGREIRRLSFEYEGNWQLARALDEVERARNAFRLAQAAVIGELRGLATRLADSGHTRLDDYALGLPAEELQQRCLMALQVLVATLWRRGEKHAERKAALRRALVHMKRLRRAQTRLQDEQSRYQRALKRWSELHLHMTQDEPKRLRRQRPARLRIQDRRVRLTDEQKLSVAASLSSYLDELDVRSEEQRLLRGERPFVANDAKRLAIHIALSLEPMIDLGNASVQIAITSSNAAYFHGLEPSFSADAKAGIAAAVVKEVKQDLGRTAEHLALRLTRVYGVPLNDEMIDWLVLHYGASRERLEIIAAAPLSEPASAVPATGSLSLSAQSGRWRHLIDAAEKVLASAP